MTATRTNNSLRVEQPNHGRIPRNQQDPLRRPDVEEPPRLSPLQPGRNRRGEGDEGPFPLQRRLLAYVPWPGADPFGPGTALRPWEAPVDSVDNAINRVRVAFEFMEKLGVPFYCFHDRDVAPEGASLAESNKNFDAVAKVLKEEQQRTGIKLLWGTANLFSNPRYVHGAATSPNADAFAFAAAQVKKALDVTKELGGDGYTFWGGREGYQNLWNTEMKREVDHLARFMHMAVDYAKSIGFHGQFYFEPKPKEPTKHQYDFDVAACINFLRPTAWRRA